MSSLAYTRLGQGAPLVLLHGIGMSRQSWDPVVPALARQFDVIAVDLPGFGDSPPNQATPADADADAANPAALARAVAVLLAEFAMLLYHKQGSGPGPRYSVAGGRARAGLCGRPGPLPAGPVQRPVRPARRSPGDLGADRRHGEQDRYRTDGRGARPSLSARAGGERRGGYPAVGGGNQPEPARPGHGVLAAEPAAHAAAAG
jgi:pimeloyl-ACP methyl ester carboxylesterase